jgi:hypothetical protein
MIWTVFREIRIAKPPLPRGDSLNGWNNDLGVVDHYIVPLMDYSSQVVTRDALHATDLQNLLDHTISALHVRNFYPKTSAIALGRELANKSGDATNWKVSTSNDGLQASDVFTLGKHDPYNVAFANQTLDDYFANVPHECNDHRRSNSDTAKILWPLDLLRLELDQVWPKGAGLARGLPSEYSNCPRGGGLTRITMGPTRWKKGFIHVDDLGPLSPQSGTFSANIYLQLPASQNPILELWPLGIYSKWDWYRVRTVLIILQSLSVVVVIHSRFSPTPTPLATCVCVCVCVCHPIHTIHTYSLECRDIVIPVIARCGRTSAVASCLGRTV